jgi:hypothetical protein
MLKNFFWDNKQPADEREALIFAEAQARAIRVSSLAIVTLILFISRLPHTTTIPLWTVVLVCVLYSLVGTIAGYTVIRKTDVILKSRPFRVSRDAWMWIATLAMTGAIQPHQPILFLGGTVILVLIIVGMLIASKKSSPENFSGQLLLAVVLLVLYGLLGSIITFPSLL